MFKDEDNFLGESEEFEFESDSNVFNDGFIGEDETDYDYNEDYNESEDIGYTAKGSLDVASRKKISIITTCVGIVGIIAILLFIRFKNSKGLAKQETRQETTVQTTVESTSKEVSTESTSMEVSTESTSTEVSTESTSTEVLNKGVVDANIVNKLGVESIKDGIFKVISIKSNAVNTGNSSTYVTSYVEGKIDGVLGTYRVEIPISLASVVKENESYNISYSVYTDDNMIYVGNIMFK